MTEEHHLFFGWVLLMLMMTIGVTQVPVGELYFKELAVGRSIVWKKATEGTARSEEECTVRCLNNENCTPYQYNGTSSGNCILITKKCGNATDAAIYWSFDSSDGLILKEGTQEMGSIPLVTGRVNKGLNLDRAKNQWVDLENHTEACMTDPRTCGTAGGAFSLWVNMITCPESHSGIISSRTPNSLGFHMYCYGNKIRVALHLPGVYFYAFHTILVGWTHVVGNYIGPNNGQGISIFMNGELVNKTTDKLVAGPFPDVDGKIVVGRIFTNIDDYYASMQVDELILFNHPLMLDEIAALSKAA